MFAFGLSLFKKIFPSLLAVFLAFIIGAMILFILGYSPSYIFFILIEGALVGKLNIGETLTQTAPIIFTGLSVMFAFRCGLFNIGAEGQLYLGAFAATLIGIVFKLPLLIHLPLALLTGMIAGGLWGLIPALLKVKRGVHEVVTTIMLNFVAIFLTNYLVNYHFKKSGTWEPRTEYVASSAQLPRLLPPTQLSAAILIAPVCAIIVYWFLWKTSIGYEIRAVGLNPIAAEYGGISVSKNVILAMSMAGILAGLGGACEVLGTHRAFIQEFSPGYGWDGIAVALLGRNHPIGIIFGALLFGVLRAGGMAVDRRTPVPFDLIFVLQSLIILFAAAPLIPTLIMKRVYWKMELEK
jgi:simple sugar transport system permease protein